MQCKYSSGNLCTIHTQPLILRQEIDIRRKKKISRAKSIILDVVHHYQFSTNVCVAQSFFLFVAAKNDTTLDSVPLTIAGTCFGVKLRTAAPHIGNTLNFNSVIFKNIQHQGSSLFISQTLTEMKQNHLTLESICVDVFSSIRPQCHWLLF